MKQVTITEDGISISGFSSEDFTGYAKTDLGSCRDVARVGLAWAMKRLADDAHLDATGDRDNQTSFIAD
ncbi:MAG: hypothetical protein KOO63_08075 [Bacteroidales bacterium]|nr:hypothetical protein [Candidatus Latescibacterota bacterium]